MQSKLLLRWALAALLVPVVAGSCASSPEFWRPERAANQREAGSVHLAVLSVAPWSHYSGALQPNFVLDAEEARRQVVRDTSSTFEQSTQGVGLGVSVTDEPDETGIREAELPSRRSSSYVPVPDPGRPDAMLEYWAATALYQEVALLNRSVRDAAIPTGYRPYLVRLQVTLMPRRRNEPYDAYTTLSFFCPPGEERDARGAEEAPAPDPLDDPLVTTLRSGPEDAGPRHLGNGPAVLPLLVTDNLEGSLGLRSQQDVRTLSLAFLGLGSFATDLQAELFQQELQAQVQGRDLNGLLTVGRVAENSLRVRLGALQQSSARHAMVPRNHHVTLLLMVPEDAPPMIDVVARTVLVDTETGAELEGTSPERVRSLLEGVSARHAALELSADSVRALLERVQANDQRGYARLVPAGTPAAEAHELWIDLVSLMVGSQFSSSRFELPGHGQWDILPAEFYDQTALLIDDGARTRVSIYGATFAEKVALSAVIQIEVGGRGVTLPADSIERGERALSLSFPSLASLGLAESARAGLDLTLRWSGDEVGFDGLYVQRLPAAAAVQTPAAPQYPGSIPGAPGSGGPQ